MLITIAGTLVAVVVLGFAALVIRARIMERRHVARVIGRVEEVVDRLMSAGELSQDRLELLAADPETRNTLFSKLESMGKTDLFPSAYRNQEAFAESDMVFWLAHPNELGCPPAEIELAARIRKNVPERESPVEFLVFRFRVAESHWAASSGWMVGITGPCTQQCDSPLASPCTFSELQPFDSKTPADHVDYLTTKMKSLTVSN